MNYKLKRFLLFFIYSIFIIYVIIQVENYGLVLRQRGMAELNMIPLSVYNAIAPIFIGLLIAIPYFVHEVRKKGKWKFDWIKFTAIGIPSLYLALFLPLVYSIPSLSQYIYPHRFTFINFNMLMTLGGIVFGYIALTSLYKDYKGD